MQTPSQKETNLMSERIKNTGLKKSDYVEILKEINSWEESCCEGRDESIDDLSETVYPEIIEFMEEDGFSNDNIQKVMHSREGGDFNEWKKVLAFAEEPKLLSIEFSEKVAMAIDSKTKQSTLDVLADSENDMIVEEVAKNTNTSVATLKKLSVHESQQVLLNVANHSSTTCEILKEMFGTHQYKWVNDIIRERVGVESLKEFLNTKKVAEIASENTNGLKLSDVGLVNNSIQTLKQ